MTRSAVAGLGCSGFRRGPIRSAALAACGSALLLLFCSTSAAGQSSSIRQWVGEDGNTLPFASTEEILEFLRTAEVISSRELKIGTTRPHLLVLEQGSARGRAVFRDVELERERARMPDGGEYAAFYDRAIHEVAAYELSLLLGMDMIPPTVERHLDGQRGTVQLWIEGAMTEGDRNEGGHQPPDVRRWRYQQQTMRVFDALVFNSDRNTGNSLVDDQWNLWMIDHTRAFQRPRGATEFPTINQVPSALWEAIQALDEDAVRDKLSPYLEPLQIASLLRRKTGLTEHVNGLIVERGVEAVVLR